MNLEKYLSRPFLDSFLDRCNWAVCVMVVSGSRAPNRVRAKFWFGRIPTPHRVLKLATVSLQETHHTDYLYVRKKGLCAVFPFWYFFVAWKAYTNRKYSLLSAKFWFGRIPTPHWVLKLATVSLQETHHTDYLYVRKKGLGAVFPFRYIVRMISMYTRPALW